MVQKKNLNKNNDYGINLPIGVPSHTSGGLINQKHGIIFGEADSGVPLRQLNLSHKIYVLYIALHKIPHVDKSDLAVGGKCD